MDLADTFRSCIYDPPTLGSLILETLVGVLAKVLIDVVMDAFSGLGIVITKLEVAVRKE